MRPMRHNRVSKSVMRVLPLVLFSSAVLASACFKAAVQPAVLGERVVEFVETVRFDPEGRNFRVWLPIPRASAYQTVELLGVESPLAHRRTTDRDSGNEMLYFESEHSGPVTIRAKYRITRRERTAASYRPEELSATDREYYLRPRGLIVINDEIRAMAAAAAGDASDDWTVARGLYDAVLARMSYDKTEPGWGRGDALRACRVGKGNCTDFHSLFIALARARGIPARFQMGLPLSGETKQSLRREYHCWAEFYTKSRGWVPVDISEAWKHESKRDYFFGGLDVNRLTVATGREIRLNPPQAGRPLNYFAYPHVEVDGKAHPLYELKRDIRTLKRKA